MSTIHQLVKHTGHIARVPRGQTPIVELAIDPGQRVVSIDVRPSFVDRDERKTVDWNWTVWTDLDTEIEVP